MAGVSDESGGVERFIGWFGRAGFARSSSSFIVLIGGEERSDFGDHTAEQVVPVSGFLAVEAEFFGDFWAFDPLPELLFPFLPGGGIEEGEGVGGDGEAEGEPMHELISELSGGGLGASGIGVIGGGEFEGVLPHFPGAEAAFGPFVEVLFGYRPAGEVGGQDDLDVGVGVEPIEEARAGFAVIKAAVEFVADGAGETGDFAGHGV